MDYLGPFRAAPTLGTLFLHWTNRVQAGPIQPLAFEQMAGELSGNVLALGSHPLLQPLSLPFLQARPL